ncbi:MAG: ATP-grasp domain-containing protein [Comamonas sp.]
MSDEKPDDETEKYSMKRVMVSAASGIVGYGILRTLRQANIQCFLLGTSIYDDSVAPAFCDAFELAPPTSSESYLAWLLDILKKHRIDMLIPGMEADMFFWSRHAQEINGTSALPLLNTPELISLCHDKWKFFQYLKSAGVSCLIDSTLESDFNSLQKNFGTPFLLKPRTGYGSRGIVRVNDEREFDGHQEKIGETLMAQPIVGSDEQEYTVSSFCDGKGGIFASMAMRRKLSRDGFTDRAEVSDADVFFPAIHELCKILQPLGPTNFQFRLCPDGPKLLEINPRISSSTSIRAAFGFNESEMALRFFLDGEAPVQPVIRSGHAVRYTDEKIFYENSIHI